MTMSPETALGMWYVRALPGFSGIFDLVFIGQSHPLAVAQGILQGTALEGACRFGCVQDPTKAENVRTWGTEFPYSTAT